MFIELKQEKCYLYQTWYELCGGGVSPWSQVFEGFQTPPPPPRAETAPTPIGIIMRSHYNHRRRVSGWGVRRRWRSIPIGGVGSAKDASWETCTERKNSDVEYFSWQLRICAFGYGRPSPRNFMMTVSKYKCQPLPSFTHPDPWRRKSAPTAVMTPLKYISPEHIPNGNS